MFVERKNATGRRLGGELPAFTDKLGPLQEWQPNWLPFSHGRAALAWWLQRQPARSVAICAYLCPSVPTFLRKRSLAIGTYDVGADVKEISALVHQLPSPRLVLVPALFGSSPWLDINSLVGKLDSTDRVIIDAAQSAFGHVEFAPPAGGAVLSCPRKPTSLTDGAILAASTMIGAREEIDQLPVAAFSAAMKAAARALWATEDAIARTTSDHLQSSERGKLAGLASSHDRPVACRTSATRSGLAHRKKAAQLQFPGTVSAREFAGFSGSRRNALQLARLRCRSGDDVERIAPPANLRVAVMAGCRIRSQASSCGRVDCRAPG